ncbi:MAG: 3-methyladenine DNA glycosylase [Verrucomicrobiota bacterium]
MKASQLESWHPGFDCELEDADEEPSYQSRYYTTTGRIRSLDINQMEQATKHRLKMALRLSRSIASRPPQYGCFGVHEWAMVYRGDTGGEIRHAENLPLRLSQEEIDAFVRSRPISCSHFDAFRFFSRGAQPMNRIQPTKSERISNEQCGCLHTNMDLYKLSGQCMPWIGSELLWQCFELAVRARQLDMQASPYDCRSLGYEAVQIETAAGRKIYEERQRILSDEAMPLRGELIQRLEQVLEA